MNSLGFARTFMWLPVLATVALLYGCPDGAQQTAEGGIEGTGRTIGPISGFGSVHVNGARLDTTQSSFLFEGQPGSEDQLFQGMVISATGDTLDAANSIEFRFSLIGVLDAVPSPVTPDCVQGDMKAVGQPLVVDDLTILRNFSADEVQCGDVIAVSGFRRSSGEIVATYLEKLDPMDALAAATVLEGPVADFDEQSLSFRIGEQLVLYAAAEFSSFPGGEIRNGLWVRVSGREEAGRLVAVSVQHQADPLADAGIDSATISGVVNAIEADGFLLGNAPVTVTEATLFENGGPSDLIVNARLVARGVRGATGELIADQVLFSSLPNISVKAMVEALNPVERTVTLGGLTAIVGKFTLLLDNSVANLPDFSYEDIAIGDHLRVFGTEQGARTLIASRLERLPAPGADDVALIEGEVDPSPADPLFSIADLPVDTSGLQDLEGFFQGDVIPIRRVDFFSWIQADDPVRAYGVPQPGLLAATRVALLNFGNLSVLDPDAVVFAGANDVAAVWDGTRNSQADIVNGTLRENMVIESASGHPFFGLPWSVHDIYVFGPGSYSIETCPDPASDGCQAPLPINFTVGPDQLGAHMLLDWGFNTDMDLALVWNINGQFPADQLYRGPEGPAPEPAALWSLASVDGDGDGVRGVAMVDGPFVGFSWNLNLNISSMPRP